MSSTEQDVTKLLRDWSDGEQKAFDELLPIVYNELRRLAHNYLNRERSDHTLQTTALVHEAYLKLVDQREVKWQNRAHFFAISAQAMRRILIDKARRHAAVKRGEAPEKLSLDDALNLSTDSDETMLALDEALNELETIDPQQSRVIELRYFGGLTIEETAEVMNLSPATIKREWAMARAWLYKKITGE